MKNLNILVVILSFLFAGSAYGTTEQATNVRNARGYTYKMCDDETTVSAVVCQNSAGNEIFAIVDRFDTLTFTFHDTGSGDNSCDIFTADQNANVTGSSNLDAEAFEFGPVNSTSLSSTQQVITLSEIDFFYVWVTCAGAGTSPLMTVEMQASVGRKRW